MAFRVEKSLLAEKRCAYETALSYNDNAMGESQELIADMSSNKTIYMDYQATTPCDPRVVEKMLPYFGLHYGNPHSRNHSYGWNAENAIEQAREEIGRAINSLAKNIIFTSGATESNNIAIKGTARFLRKQFGKNHIITTNTEHKCVLESVESLAEEGFEVTYLEVNSDGLLDLNKLRQAISSNTGLVSVASVHNEIGVIQPTAEIGEICNELGVYFHTDAAQAIGKIAIDVDAMNIDLMSISGHKVYGPKGIGALYIRSRPSNDPKIPDNPKSSKKRRVRLYPLFSGGGQERGFRSGTLPTPLCVGMGEAIRIGEEMREKEWKLYREYFDYFVNYLESHLEHVYLNGSRTKRVWHNVNISFRFVEGESLMLKIPDIAVSSGSACTSASLEPSYVLKALGVNEELAHTSLRFGFGRLLSMEDVKYAARSVVAAVQDLRKISPLYEMYQEGIDLSTIQWSSH